MPVENVPGWLADLDGRSSGVDMAAAGDFGEL